mgnify:CR=1 FL=1
MKHLAYTISLLFICLTGNTHAQADKPLPVFVSIQPQKFFVQQIGGNRVDVQLMVQPGASPATYEPKPRQMAALSEARLYFAVGVPFENVWLEKIAAANPAMEVVHTDHGIEKRAMAAHHHDREDTEHHDEGESQESGHHAEGHHDHEKRQHHGDAGHDKDHHEHAGLDPHIWLSPQLVKIQARAILNALKEADPGHRNVYESNFRDFAARIDQLDADLKKIFAGKEDLQFMVFHPAWGYFARDYGLVQVPIEIEGKNPKPAQLQALIAAARSEGIKVIFVQPQFSTKRAKLVAREIGGQVVAADPLALNWLENMRVVAGKFEAALK